MKIFIKTLILVYCAIVYSCYLNAQAPSDTPTGYYEQHVPPSPNASSLGVYGEIPVSYYTGIPSINIPIYDIKNGDIDLNISLNYFSLSNKVEEESSWIGLGWSLNAGGVITRVKRGFCDITPNGGLSSGPQSISSCFVDKEMDYFYYNFSGYSGKFVIDKSDNSIKQIIQTDLKIEKIDDNASGFIITLPSGIIYEFRQKEYTRIIENISYLGDMVYLYPSSWFLTKIKSPLQREINFEYTSNSYPSEHNYVTEIHNFRYSFSHSESPHISEDEYDDIFSSFFDFGSDPSTKRYDIDKVTSINYNVYLKKIDFGEGTIEFLTKNREDLKTIPDRNVPQAIDRIMIKEKTRNSIVKNFLFITNYFNSGQTGPDFQTKRLKLEKIQELNSVNAPIKEHQFEYNTVVNLPNKNSEAKDYWGFYNGQLNNDNLDVINRVHSSNNTYLQANLLSSIRYPTGGQSSFLFEECNFYNRGSLSAGGGHRIKRIISHDGNRETLKLFDYNIHHTNQTTTGKLISGVRTQYDFKSDGYITRNGVRLHYRCDYTNHSNSNCLILGDGSGGHFVGHDRVTVYTDENGLLGKTVYNFYNQDIPNPQTFDYIPNWPKQVHPMNGLLLNDTVYEKRADQYFPLQVNTYSYSTANQFEIYSYVSNPLRRSYDDQMPVGCMNSMASYSLQSNWIYQNEQVTKDYNKNNPQTYLEHKKKFYYESNVHKQITKVESYLSSSLFKTVLFKYPTEINLMSGLTEDQILAINKLKDQYRLNTILEEVDNRENLSSRIRTNYFINADNVVLPQDVEKQNGYGDIYSIINYTHYGDLNVVNEFLTEDGITTSIIWGYNGTMILGKALNASYDKVFCTSFEEDPNSILDPNNSKTGEKVMYLNSALQIQKLFPTGEYLLSYFWRPTLNDSWQLVKETKNLTSQNYISTDKNNGIIDEVRIYPTNATMTTYTYLPLVGITSITDENNNSTYYEYDSFGRLEYIKDNNKQILKNIEYNYGTPDE